MSGGAEVGGAEAMSSQLFFMVLPLKQQLWDAIKVPQWSTYRASFGPRSPAGEMGICTRGTLLEAAVAVGGGGPGIWGGVAHNPMGKGAYMPEYPSLWSDEAREGEDGGWVGRDSRPTVVHESTKYVDEASLGRRKAEMEALEAAVNSYGGAPSAYELCWRTLVLWASSCSAAIFSSSRIQYVLNWGANRWRRRRRHNKIFRPRFGLQLRKRLERW
ncbi:hypothetical protein B0H12DRAFT_1082509 [Mycena haematopus]|nr:hypothetical protein B0H12DRAFT_1082509 [Mycena haematopus]